MNKPRILVLTAAGRTGMPVALQLLSEGFPVTAFVHREDQRSARLKAHGAEIVVGSLTDITDMRRAMEGVERAYFCVPPEAGNLTSAAVFAAAAVEQQLESLVVMSQWLASPVHPSLHTREVWLADRLLAQLPNTAVTTINVGFFADNDMQVLAFAAQFGLLMLPYGAGRNAPPSNEDIAAVVAAILARPEGHAGKTYRPTGPALLSPQDIAATFAKVLGHRVRYINAPVWSMLKVMRGMGFSPYVIAQFPQYIREYQRDTFAVSAPTTVVRDITGREPEDFETIARRYAASMPDAKRSVWTQLKLMLMMPIWMLRLSPNTTPYLALNDFSDPNHIGLDADSAEWQQTHQPLTQQPVNHTVSRPASFVPSALSDA